jgi:hypothetical protein
MWLNLLIFYSYAAKEIPSNNRQSTSKSRSRSHSPVNSGQITYITSFGGDDSDNEGAIAVQGPSLPLHMSVKATSKNNNSKASTSRSVVRSFCNTSFIFRQIVNGLFNLLRKSQGKIYLQTIKLSLAQT